MVKEGKYREALAIIMEDLPLPGVLGRICPHGCEDACRRAEKDHPVAIRDLKRLAADQADPREIAIACAPPRPETVAIIGSGPAGLSCAYHLARRGIRATIFEALPAPGGMLAAASFFSLSINAPPDYSGSPLLLERPLDQELFPVEHDPTHGDNGREPPAPVQDQEVRILAGRKAPLAFEEPHGPFSGAEPGEARRRRTGAGRAGRGTRSPGRAERPHRRPPAGPATERSRPPASVQWCGRRS